MEADVPRELSEDRKPRRAKGQNSLDLYFPMKRTAKAGAHDLLTYEFYAEGQKVSTGITGSWSQASSDVAF
ncbi:hypothetical protein JTE90_014275 [Oedothorax gibbosus]|uniref:Uncharacterized protein n=1 Tax=Oedothorax gibbosus TaxID=931172 RepID=A0AAV6TI06_9ARAC|nr:hypothetical protein JTE90_014275 [Oedothorax gibbosus]